MDSRAKLDKLNIQLKSAHQEVKLASNEESIAWNNYQAIKLENENTIEVLSQSNPNSFLKKEIKKLDKEINLSEKDYDVSLHNLQKIEARIERLRIQIIEINRQRYIAKKSGVNESYIDFAVVKKDRFMNNAFNIYFNDNPNTFGPKHGHYAITETGPYYKREIGEPKGQQNYLNSPDYANKNNAINDSTNNLLSIA